MPTYYQFYFNGVGISPNQYDEKLRAIWGIPELYETILRERIDHFYLDPQEVTWFADEEGYIHVPKLLHYCLEDGDDPEWRGENAPLFRLAHAAMEGQLTYDEFKDKLAAFLCRLRVLTKKYLMSNNEVEFPSIISIDAKPLRSVI